MALAEKDVKEIARLARIQLTQDQKKQFARELTEVVSFVDQLKKADVKDVPETAHVTGLLNVTRADEPKPSLPREAFLKNAPAQKDDQLKVKGVFS